jgi:hypothetical protein
MRQKLSSHFGNLAGAFADGAILFPLLAALVLHTGMDGAVLLASAGAAYIAAGLFFRVPMSVQPLKSVVVGALALGASAADIRVAGVGIGLFCLAVALLPVMRLEKYIPRHLIHGVQFSLGLLLILKGVQWAWGDSDALSLLAVGVFVPAAIFVQSRITIPVLGIIALLGMVSGLWFGDHHAVVTAVPKTEINIGIILSLLLPQLALTLTNSVVGTYDTARHYFGAAASRVTLKGLLLSIGFGNILMSLVGGLNFCHGSGGLTAHVKAGAKSYAMNLYIGFLLVVLAALSFIFKLDFIPHYPVLLMAALVGITGWYHIRLADKSWVNLELRLIIIVMGAMVLFTQNMLYGLLTGILFEILRRKNWLGIKQWYLTKKL